MRIRYTLPIAALTLVGLETTASAQTQVPGTPYIIERVSETYSGCPDTINNLSTGDGGGVQDDFDVTLPFPFQFYDQSYTTVTIGATGAIGFPQGQILEDEWDALGTAAPPNAVAAIWWHDLELLTGNGFLGTSVSGTAPNRIFCVEWNGFNDEQVNASVLNFKIQLHEGAAGQIDFVYDTPGGSTGSYNATAGLEDAAGARPVELFANACSPNCDHPDLVAAADTRITVTRDAGVEILAVGVTVPQFTFLDSPIDLPVSVSSLHGNPIGPFAVAVEASADEAFTDPVTVGTSSVTLTGFQQLTTDIEVVVPSSEFNTGRAYFRVVADSTGVINETVETNNTAPGDRPTRLLEPSADLSVERVTLGQFSVDSGQDVTVFGRIRNVGGLPVNAGEIGIYLSTNPVISAQDLSLDTFTVDLAPGETINATVSATIPANTNSGTYYVGLLADPNRTLDELNETNNSLASLGTLDVAGVNLAVSTTALPLAYLQQSYVALLQANGGELPFEWEITEGDLCDGLGLVSQTGELFGRPQAVEMQTFTVQVTDAGGQTASAELSCRVVDPQEPLTIVTRSIPAARVGQEYSFALELTGDVMTSAAMWSATGLPPGIQITEAGILAGTPEEVGTSTLTVTAEADGETAMRELVLEVVENDNLLLRPRPLDTARLEAQYTHQFEATGGIPPLTFLIRDTNNLPDGLSMGPDGVLSGAPEEVGRFTFTVEVRDAGTNGADPAVDTGRFELRVLDAGNLVITTEDLPEGFLNEGYDAVVAATGGQPPYTWDIADGRLPDGLIADEVENTGELRIAGAPEAAGISNLLIRVTDARGSTAVRAFGLLVSEEAPMMDLPVDPNPDDGCDCRTSGSGSSGLIGAALGLAGLWWLRRRRR